jgi:hypothetical protein
LIVGIAFALVTVVASLLVARKLTDSSWPLDHAEPALVAAAALAYLASLVFRARAWHRLSRPANVPTRLVASRLSGPRRQAAPFCRFASIT